MSRSFLDRGQPLFSQKILDRHRLQVQGGTLEGPRPGSCAVSDKPSGFRKNGLLFGFIISGLYFIANLNSSIKDIMFITPILVLIFSQRPIKRYISKTRKDEIESIDVFFITFSISTRSISMSYVLYEPNINSV